MKILFLNIANAWKDQQDELLAVKTQLTGNND